MRKPVLLFGAVAVVLVIAGSIRSCSSVKQPTVVINGSGEAFTTLKAERDAALREADDLREKLADALRGRSTVTIDTIVRYDTIIQPDTVLLYVAIDDDGRATVDAGVRADSGFVPDSRKLDVADCDDGITIGPSGVVCDRARLGHLEFFASVGVSRDTFWTPFGSAGFAWQPSYRSTLDVSAGVNTDRKLFIAVRKGVRLF